MRLPSKIGSTAANSLELALYWQNVSASIILLQYPSTNLGAYLQRQQNYISLIFYIPVFRNNLFLLFTVLKELRKRGFEPSPTEAVYIANYLIKHPNSYLANKAKRLLPSVPVKEELHPERIASINIEENIALSGTAYLKTLGFSDDEIKQLKNNTNREQENSYASNPTLLWQTNNSETTWINGKISTANSQIIAVRQSINCYFYADRKALELQNCPPELIEKFAAVDPIFDGNRIKKISANGKPLIINVVLPGATTSSPMEITHELKLSGIPDRVYLFKLQADNSCESLYWACYYDKSGLHDTKDIVNVSVSSQVIILCLPDKNEVTEEVKSTLSPQT